jgi:hypothetical protein
MGLTYYPSGAADGPDWMSDREHRRQQWAKTDQARRDRERAAFVERMLASPLARELEERRALDEDEVVARRRVPDAAASRERAV